MMGKYKIIVVENDEDERLFMKESFDSVGLFELITMVASGDELLIWLQNHTDILPDIILSDLNMPGKNGYDILTAIKGNTLYMHIPVLITSTSSTQAIIDKCLAMGATSYFIKPDTFLNYQPFIERLFSVIENRQLLK